jgi:septal ring factor EnvC (AmiA/AmiB activator)
MQSFLGTLRKAPGYVALIIAVAMSTTAALTAAIVVSSLVGRVEKLESDLARTQTKLVELTAAQSRLSASIDTADRSIKSLRSDLDHPRVRPLASIVNSGPFLRQWSGE